MEYGDMQIYDTPQKRIWTNPLAVILVILMLAAGLGVYAAYF